MTHQTYTLAGVESDLDTSRESIVFKEKEGIDYAATTVQLLGGERVPFHFSVKDLVAKGSGPAFKPIYHPTVPVSSLTLKDLVE